MIDRAIDRSIVRSIVRRLYQGTQQQKKNNRKRRIQQFLNQELSERFRELQRATQMLAVAVTLLPKLKTTPSLTFVSTHESFRLEVTPWSVSHKGPLNCNQLLFPHRHQSKFLLVRCYTQVVVMIDVFLNVQKCYSSQVPLFPSRIQKRLWFCCIAKVVTNSSPTKVTAFYSQYFSGCSHNLIVFFAHPKPQPHNKQRITFNSNQINHGKIKQQQQHEEPP